MTPTLILDLHTWELCRNLIPDPLQGAVEARFTVALPARGRSILGNWAAQILCQNLPRHGASHIFIRKPKNPNPHPN